MPHIQSCRAVRPWRAISHHRNPCEFDLFQSHSEFAHPERHLCRTKCITTTTMVCCVPRKERNSGTWLRWNQNKCPGIFSNCLLSDRTSLLSIDCSPSAYRTGASWGGELETSPLCLPIPSSSRPLGFCRLSQLLPTQPGWEPWVPVLVIGIIVRSTLGFLSPCFAWWQVGITPGYCEQTFWICWAPSVGWTLQA